MVDFSTPPQNPGPLEHADASLERAVAHLMEAEDAYRRAGRADLAATLLPALVAAHQTELLRKGRPGELRHRDPADLFQDD